VAYDDLRYDVQRGERAKVVQRFEQLGALIALLDSIGWGEHPEAPDEQPIVVDRAVAVWAAPAADEWSDCLHDDAAYRAAHPDEEPVVLIDEHKLDSDLLLLATLRQLAGADESSAA
jgi:hypothetical protein